jgi:hypothetical protein
MRTLYMKMITRMVFTSTTPRINMENAVNKFNIYCNFQLYSTSISTVLMIFISPNQKQNTKSILVNILWATQDFILKEIGICYHLTW